MEISESAAPNKVPLSPGAKVFISVVALASAPGYITALILALGYVVQLMVGRHYHSPFYDRFVDILGGIAMVLPLLGILTHLVALLMVFIGSLCRMSRRGKIFAWEVFLGGILGWAVAWRVIWFPYAHQ